MHSKKVIILSGFNIVRNASMCDTNGNDMLWDVNDSQFVIQGVPNFNLDRSILLDLAVANEGEISIKIDAQWNFNSLF